MNSDEHWSSRLMFILAATGSAIGLGNVWRFPYVAGLYGGGTFIIAYIGMLILFVIPGMAMEISAGAEAKDHFFKGFKKLLGKFWFVSFLPFFMCLIIFPYYITINGWVLFYFVSSISGSAPVFTEAVNGWGLALGSILALVIVSIVSAMGIQRGIEKLNLCVAPMLFIAMIFLVVNVMGSSGASKSIEFLTKVDLGALANPQLLIAAFTQALFSLSVGVGIMFTYGSYLTKKSKLLNSITEVAVLDTAFSLLSSLLIFTLVFTFAMSPATGPALIFETLPNTLGLIPFGNILLPLFFLLLFCAATTSAVSVIEVLVSGVMSLGLKRGKALSVVLAGISVFFIAAVLSYSPVGLKIFGMPVINFFDEIIVGHGAPIVMTTMVLALAWKWKNAGRAFSSTFSPFFGKIFYSITKYILPLTILLQML